MSNKYYAIVQAGADLTKPCLVMGWVAQPVAQDGTSTPYQAAPGFEAVPLEISDEDWAMRTQGPQNPTQINQGKLEPYVAPGPSLKEQATNALQQARMTVYNEFGIFGEPTPANWIVYLKALMTISNGTDTTSTALPAAPSDAAG